MASVGTLSYHTAQICKQRRAQYGIQLLENPPSSPDLNPIENMWFIFKNLLGKRTPIPRTREELRAAAEEVWNKEITFDHINAVINSMEKRRVKVLSQRGGPLKY
jgi:transposase